MYGVYPIGYSVLGRGLTVGYGVYVWWVWRWHGVGLWCAMALVYGVQACVGTVYGAMALVWRWCALGVYVWCTCVYALGVRVYVDTLTW